MEVLVGLPFFADPELEQLIRTDPNLVEPAEVRFRAELYSQVVRAAGSFVGQTIHQDSGRAAPARSDWESVSDWSEAFRADHSELMGTVRGELMERDEALKPESVRRLEAALIMTPKQQEPSGSGRHRESNLLVTQPMPPHAITLRSAARIVNTSWKNLLHYAETQLGEVPTIHLPHTSRAEKILSWDIVRQIGETVGYLAGVEIDFDALPLDSDDTDPNRVANARDLQRRFMPANKLVDTPGLVSPEEMAAMEQFAKSYHVPLRRIEQLVSGGVDFSEEYICQHSIRLVCRWQHYTPGAPGKWRVIHQYLFKEQAAEIYDAYLAVPDATDAYIPLYMIARRAAISSRSVAPALNPHEAVMVQQMRTKAQQRWILPHLPKAVADVVAERLSRKALLPHQIPVQNLPSYIGAGYSAIMKRLAETPVVVPHINLIGTKVPRNCCDWAMVRYLERVLGRRQDAEGLDYDRLPLDANDQDPAKIAYAREVQRRFGLEAFIEERVTNTATAQRSIGEYDPLKTADNEAIAVISETTGFTQAAVERLLAERAFGLEEGHTTQAVALLAPLRPPPGHVSLDATAQWLDMDIRKARDFLIRLRRSRIRACLDEYGHPGLYVDDLSRQMLVRQRYPAGEDDPEGSVPIVEAGEVQSMRWVHLGQILPLVDASAADFESWAAQHVSSVQAQWMKTAKGPVLPYYLFEMVEPFIRSHQRQNPGGIKKHT